ncbi:MAG TPA: glycoside hydrolase family 44 protein [Polyangium sp.]|nr:glycoside hydrolase family 44 protein [Polyangium sp.]
MRAFNVHSFVPGKTILLAASMSILACSGNGNSSSDNNNGGGGAGGENGASSSSSSSGGNTSSSSSSSSGVGGGSSSSSSSSSSGTGGSPGMIVEPSNPGAGDVTFTVRADNDVHAISPLIYGVNQVRDLDVQQRGAGLVRMGGNRLTAYNWENNASNAGTDYLNQSDGYLVMNIPNGDKPGEAVRVPAANALAKGAAFLATVPICGYVAADKNGGGDVNQTPNYLQTRFRKTVARKNGTFSQTPDLGDDSVYQDEFVAFLKTSFPAAFNGSQAQFLFSLDNEPDLWSSTHPRIHPNPVGYAELVQKDVDFAKAVKDVAPNAIVTGFVSYGYNGYVTLQNAPDQNGNFIDYWLDAMKMAETQAGKRVVDVLDLHWYPEAKGNGQRITGDDTSAGSVQARSQAPRSLWDPTYKEDSWIANDYLNGPIALIPWLKAKIDAHYPGTKIGFTEYWYGGGAHISGALAAADVLGIFGREDVFLANMWELNNNVDMAYAALRAYTSYDGQGAHFGDTSVRATSSDVAKASVYASIDAQNAGRMVLVAINKTTGTVKASMQLAAYGDYKTADIWQLAGTQANLVSAASISAAATNGFIYDMPALSVSVIVPRP